MSRVDIERAGDKIKVTITTARPGVVIGKKGAEIDALRKKLEKVADGPVSIDVVEVKRPELDAELIAQSVAEQLEGRVAFRPRHAQGRAVRHEVRRQGHPHPVLRPSGRRRDEPPRVVPRGSRAAAHPPREDRLRLRHRRYHHGLHRVQVWVYHGEVLPGQKAPQPALEGSSRPNRSRRNDRRERGDK